MCAQVTQSPHLPMTICTAEHEPTTDHELPFGLLGLPVELLTEIVKALSWKDVLRMRETCKLLSVVTRSRSIWAHLVQEHISSKEVPPRLERPIELYTSHELERVLLRWKSAEIGWERDDGRPASERSFHCEPPGLTHLIQGGRWFLVTSEIGAVTYYDLEAETISGVQLIPSQFLPSLWQGPHVALEVDHTSPLLKFNIAISSTFSEPQESHSLHIWSVSTVLDDSGHAVGLSASHLSVLRHPHKLSYVSELSLCGPYVGFLGYLEQDKKDYVAVVHWDQGDSHPYRFRIVGRDFYSDAKLRLLPGTRLLLFVGGMFRLYDHSAVEETTNVIADSDDIDRALLWTQSFQFDGDVGRKNILSWFYVDNTARILVSGFQSLYTFSINTISDEPTPVHELEILRCTNQTIDSVRALGPSRAVLYDDRERRFTSMTYDPPDSAHPSSPILYKSILPEVSQKFRLLALDEESGRAVLSCRGGSMGYVISYALHDCAVR